MASTLTGSVRQTAYNRIRGLNMLCAVCKAQAERGTMEFCPVCIRNIVTGPEPTVAVETATAPVATAQALVAPRAKRTRQGTNNSYSSAIAGLRPTAFCQLMGYWGYTAEQCAQCVDMLWADWPVAVNGETIKTGWRDGRTHGVKKDGVTPYKDYKVPQILKQLGANVDAVQAAVKACLTGSTGNN